MGLCWRTSPAAVCGRRDAKIQLIARRTQVGRKTEDGIDDQRFAGVIPADFERYAVERLQDISAIYRVSHSAAFLINDGLVLAHLAGRGAHYQVAGPIDAHAIDAVKRQSNSS